MNFLKNALLWVASIIIVLALLVGTYALWITLIVGSLATLVFLGFKVTALKNI